jgi:hypothetical protein
MTLPVLGSAKSALITGDKKKSSVAPKPKLKMLASDPIASEISRRKSHAFGLDSELLSIGRLSNGCLCHGCTLLAQG